jgi:hypothetical protein
MSDKARVELRKQPLDFQVCELIRIRLTVTI